MSKHWLVTGASGLLGHALCQFLVSNGHKVTGISHAHALDITGADELHLDLISPKIAESLISDSTYDVVVHCAGITNVDACEADEAKARDIHARVAGELAASCMTAGVKMVYISTDHLWDGSKPMVEEEEPARPMNAYARTKLAGEQAVLEAAPEALVIRTNFYGAGRPWRASLSDWIIHELSSGHAIKAFADVYFTPICLSRLCPILVELVGRGAQGVFNVAGGERISKYDFAIRLAQEMGLSTDLVEKGSVAGAGLGAFRPCEMSLSAKKVEAFLGRPMPNLDECFDDLQHLKTN